MEAIHPSKKLLILFTRNPELGRVKTRLAQEVGDKKALAIYRFLIRHTVKITQPVSADKVVYYSENITENDYWNSNFFQKKLQTGNDLGQRMKNAFSKGFSEGYQQIIIMGTDLYDIKTADIEFAFSTLENHEAILGPAEDGGYYLLGLTHLIPNLFENKNWSTPSVLPDTLNDLTNINYKLLQKRNDVDYYADIEYHPAFSHFFTELS